MNEPTEQPAPEPPLNRIRIIGNGERRAVELQLETVLREEKRLGLLCLTLMRMAQMVEWDIQKLTVQEVEKQFEAMQQPPVQKPQSNIIRPNGFHP